jgi:signal transduction histidine kinase
MGRGHALVISVLSTGCWWFQDTVTHHPYTAEWHQMWNTVIYFAFFLMVIFAGYAARQQRDANRARIDLLERSQKLERQIISISEREQQRIGRDLHDGLGQHLVAIGLAADSVRDDLEKGSGASVFEAGKIADLLHEAVVRTREIARGLSPIDRDEGGLAEALEELATGATQLSGIPCSFLSDGPDIAHDPVRDLHLFRIAQEALNNAIKHARPKVIVIALEYVDGGISLRVSDDGVGLPVDASGRDGMGFNIMRYRARMVGGELETQPNFPTGTVVACSIPHIAEARAAQELTLHE